MLTLFAIIFTMSLIYLVSGTRLITYIQILCVQGLLLFGIAFMELHDIDLGNLLFILMETLIFKAIVVPYLFHRLITKNHFSNERPADSPNFFSLFTISLIIVVSFILSYNMHNQHLKITYFTTSISAIFTGLLLIIKRRKLITHIVGYMVLENGIFLLSLSLGSELPMIVNIGILLDLFTSVLLFGMFVSKIGELHRTEEANQLTELKD